jgi:hypothetical protein
MQKYNFRIPKFTTASLVAATGGVTTGSVITFIVFPGTNRSFLLTEIDLQGMGTSSADAEFAIFRTITTAAVGALTTVIVGQPTSSVATPPTFSGSAGQGSFATTQPTLAGAPLYTIGGPNANGQRYFWRANPNLDNAIDVPGTATSLLNGLAIVQIGGTAAVAAAGRVQLSEI